MMRCGRPLLRSSPFMERMVRASVNGLLEPVRWSIDVPGGVFPDEARGWTLPVALAKASVPWFWPGLKGIWNSIVLQLPCAAAIRSSPFPGRTLLPCMSLKKLIWISRQKRGVTLPTGFEDVELFLAEHGLNMPERWVPFPWATWWGMGWTGCCWSVSRLLERSSCRAEQTPARAEIPPGWWSSKGFQSRGRRSQEAIKVFQMQQAGAFCPRLREQSRIFRCCYVVYDWSRAWC